MFYRIVSQSNKDNEFYNYIILINRLLLHYIIHINFSTLVVTSLIYISYLQRSVRKFKKRNRLFLNIQMQCQY